MKRFSLLLMAIVVSTVLVTGSAFAIPITGEIHFAGLFVPTGGTGSTDLAGATGINIPWASVLLGTGSFSGLGFGTPVAFSSLTFSPSTAANPLWSVNGFSFNLASVAVDFQSAAHLALSGLGTLTGAGFDDTLGSWSFSGDAGQYLFSFSSNGGAAAPVPEPSTLLLLGSGLVGLAGMRMRKRS